VKVLGTPKPTVQWYKDDMEVRWILNILSLKESSVNV
jgi:hypothetical protein